MENVRDDEERDAEKNGDAWKGQSNVIKAKHRKSEPDARSRALLRKISIGCFREKSKTLVQFDGNQLAVKIGMFC